MWHFNILPYTSVHFWSNDRLLHEVKWVFFKWVFYYEKCYHSIANHQICLKHYLELLNELKFEVTAQVSQELSINFFNPLCLTHSISNANCPLFISCDFSTVQWCAIEMQHLLRKPYVNEVTLNGQNPYLKSY